MTVLAVFGPTASGKTAVAEQIAERIPASLVSADSMQVYRGLPILTAQPEGQTQLVGIWELDHEASVVEYQRLAHDAIDAALERGRTPVVVGGTGLYLRAALSDLAPPPAPSPGSRARWERVYDRLGPEQAHALLLELDAPAAARIHANDRRRVVRALELAELGESLQPARDVLWSSETRHPTLLLGLEVSREELERRIEARARAMFGAGVEEEVRRALTRPISSTARHALGLDEIATLSREDAIAALVLRTRRYAAYQRKWMRKLPELIRVDAERPPNEVADEILEVARARERLPAH
ncbi:MAG TPA: tRNA (adenosine(37)-N6)-dimethylallyltransferase MiaA [Gaiellaceae bacterium]|nr:tRNA (adenosine(37)-N6)-dimethylallyltransferase MiaA [Gaiellaceae bacterium]